MTFVMMRPLHRIEKARRKKSDEAQRVLDVLDKYLEGSTEEPVKWLVRFWRDQAAALTYRELMSIVTEKEDAGRIFSDWFQDYSRLISGRMTKLWEEAFVAGAKSNPAYARLGEEFTTSETNVRRWIVSHTGEMITACTQEQIKAVRYIVAESHSQHMASAETARYIRPAIGLTEQQASANLKLYTSVKEKLREDHPRMSDESIEKKAREAAGRYAEKQQMARAETIAMTENAKAFNRGNHEYIRQMMNKGYMPVMREKWSTAGSGDVCAACEDLEGTEVAFDAEFKVSIGKKKKRELVTDIPPIHPRCRCALEYVETDEYLSVVLENPLEIDTMETEEYGIASEGKRNEEPLTDEQFAEAERAARKQGYDGEIFYSNDSNTAFHAFIEGDNAHYLVIGTDAFPMSTPGSTANERITVQGCMAHEVVGHYMAWKKGTSKSDYVLEEVQASIRASRFGIDLTDEERETLLEDALERLDAAGLSLDEVIDQLDIEER